MILVAVRFILARQWLALPLVAALSFGSAWVSKGILDEFECANEARVAALKIELANEKTINSNNEALRTAAAKDIASLKIEIQKRKERNNALIEQFKTSGCDFTDDELERLRGAGEKAH